MGPLGGYFFDIVNYIALGRASPPEISLRNLGCSLTNNLPPRTFLQTKLHTALHPERIELLLKCAAQCGNPVSDLFRWLESRDDIGQENIVASNAAAAVIISPSHTDLLVLLPALVLLPDPLPNVRKISPTLVWHVLCRLPNNDP